LLLALSGLAELSAQDFERFAPKLPPTGENGKISQASDDDLDPDADAATVELLPSLKGLVFVPAVSDVRVDGRPGVAGVLVENVAMMDETQWQERFSERIGTRFTMADLSAVMREVILYYREAGRPVVDVVVVEQDITSGVVQLAVVEATSRRSPRRRSSFF
jgi:hemolysin activation/secretion protein